MDPGLKQARVVLRTNATSGPSADAIRDTAVSLRGQNLTVRVPDVEGIGGSTTIRMGNSTMTFSGGSGVQIINGNVHVTGHGGGKVFVNGREVTPGGTADTSGPTPIEAVISLPAGSMALLSTHTARTTVSGELARLDYDATSGSLSADRVGELDATITSGSVNVRQVTGSLTANLTSGNLAIGSYSGSDARLNLTSGNVSMAATPQATGRLAVNATSGNAHVTGAAHLNVRRRATSGYVHIS